MLQQLINLVKENAGQAIMNNADIPADRKEEAVQAAGTSIVGGLQEALSKGDIKDVMKMFSGKSANLEQNPVTEQINGSFINELSSKFGLSNAQAGGMASSLIPSVLGQLVNKTNDPGDSSFDLQGIFNQLSGGKTSGLDVGSILGKFSSGLDKDGDGDVDLEDLKGMFSGASSGGGGILDAVKSIFK